ncbi:conjugative transposon protein TraM [Paraflavitalea pollutisoli]|uniref:conjugative transposon protein TraM n=1 Tax=Paraflavitalea pollutisoli TaxID=3034143 RepID=UPI0023EAE3ED|nr:conjugative transposon protein TraM [Paraflavitalea sp. H1-2-19X]
MEKKNEINHSQKFLRHRKFMLLLPLLVLPFLTFVAYSAGIIGKNDAATKTEERGYNMRLPDAAPAGDSNWNKLAFYEKADKDSVLRRSIERADPYRVEGRQPFSGGDTGGSSVSRFKYDPVGEKVPPTKGTAPTDVNEQRVYKKLAELDRELNRQQTTAVSVDPSPGVSANSDVERLERMMASVSDDNGSDEFSQINNVLEKILDVQHPARVREKIKERSVQQKTSVFPVSVLPDEAAVSLMSGRIRLDTAGLQQRVVNRFYGLEDAVDQSSLQRSIRAVIPEHQTLVHGATVKLMLMDDVYIRGELIPRHTAIYGISNIGGERILINVTSLRHNGNIYPVSLEVYDMDGLEGIFVPGSISRDVSKQSTDQAIQSLGIASLDPSLGAQAASAGLQAAKTLIGKKTRLIRANIPGNYSVLLRDANNQE